MIAERYTKNLGSFINEQQQVKMNNATIAIIGMGGNGGYIAEFLTRLGVRHLICYDGDKYEESNLNRQLFCTPQNIGQYKVNMAKDFLSKVNPDVQIDAIPLYFEPSLADGLILQKPDLILRAADAFQNPKALNQALRNCLRAGIPVIDSYLFEAGMKVNVHVPSDIQLFDEISEDQENHDASADSGISQPAFLCAMGASFAANEATKFLNNTETVMTSYQLVFDLFETKMHLITKERVVY